MVRTHEVLSKLIEKGIKEIAMGDEPVNLYEPISYILNIGGKRMRPLLTLMSYQLFAETIEDKLEQSLSVEVFHNFTLMHDDIMDEAPLRRASETVHKKWSVNTAILSGDVMMVKAYQLLAKDSKNLHPILTAFNKCAIEVCEGQQYDMDFELREDVTEAEYLNMIRLKTAVLLGFSLELGALLADKMEETEHLYNLGVNMGMGFQLMDDYLDAFGDPKKFGKQVGGDIMAGKKTYLTLKAFELADKKQTETLNEAFKKKSKYSDAEKVEKVKLVYTDLGIDKLTKAKMEEYFEEASKFLFELNAPLNRKSIIRNYFEQLAGREN